MEFLSHSTEVSNPPSHHLPQTCPAQSNAHGSFSRGQLSNPPMLRYNQTQPYEPVHNHPHHYPPIHPHHSWGLHNPGSMQWSTLPPISAPSFPHMQGHSQQMAQSRMSAPHPTEPYSNQSTIQYSAPSSLPPPSHVTIGFSGHQPSHPTHSQQPSSIASQHHHQVSGSSFGLPSAPSHPPNIPSLTTEPNQAGAGAGAGAGTGTGTGTSAGAGAGAGNGNGAGAGNVNGNGTGAQVGAGTNGPVRHAGPPVHPHRHSFHASQGHYSRLSGQYNGPPGPHSQPSLQTNNQHPNASGPYSFSYERSYPRSYSPPGNAAAHNLGAYSSAAPPASVAQGPAMSSSSGPPSGPNPASSSIAQGTSSTQHRPHSLYSSSSTEHPTASSSLAGSSPNPPPQISSSLGYPVPSPAPLSAHPTNGNPRVPYPYGDYSAPPPPFQQLYPDNAGPGSSSLSVFHHHHHPHHPHPPPPPENRRRTTVRSRRHQPHRVSTHDVDSDDEYSPPADVMEQLARDMRGDEMSVRAAQFLRGQVSSKMVASPSAVASLESVAIDSLPENERSCIICYNDFGTDTPEGVNEAPLRLPECKHVFGDHCIKKWFEDSDSCPYCRTKVPAQPRVEVNARALQEYARSRGRNINWTGTSDEAVVRLMHANGLMDMPILGTTGSRRSPPTDPPENRRRIRPRYTGSSSNREGGSSTSTGTSGGGSRPQSFTSPSPPRPTFDNGPIPAQPMQFRLDRVNDTSARPRPYSIHSHSHGDGYSNSTSQQRISADLQFGFFSRPGPQPHMPGGPSSTDADRPSNNFFPARAPMQQPRASVSNNRAQVDSEDIHMSDATSVADSIPRPIHSANM